MPSYFITGTGTDIGKTWLSAALLRHFRAIGEPARAYKPIMSGVDADNLAASDAGQLLLAQGQAVNTENVAEITPWRFAAPLSPDMAAAAEGRSIDWRALRAHSRRLLSGDPLGFAHPRAGAGVEQYSTNSQRRLTSPDFAGLTLIEGVGGVMVPLDDTHTVLDWIAATGVPAVLVAGSYLGSMSHTLTALLALQARAITVAAIAVNESPGSSVPLADTLTSLRRHIGDVPLVGIVRDTDPTADAGVAALAHILLAS